MKPLPLPLLHIEPRVHEDLRDCMQFLERQPWSNPSHRLEQVLESYQRIARAPQLYRIGARRRALGLELRRLNVAQFAVIYAYIAPTDGNPTGTVSIRAVRHGSVRNVFWGVRDGDPWSFPAQRH